MWKSPLKQRVASDWNGDAAKLGGKMTRNSPTLKQHLKQTHSVTIMERLSKSLAPRFDIGKDQMTLRVEPRAIVHLASADSRGKTNGRRRVLITIPRADPVQ